MPSGGGPVYQPTTVSYEPRSGHAGNGGPRGLLAPTSSMSMESPLRIFRKYPYLQCPLLLLVILSLSGGIALLVSSLKVLLEARELINKPSDKPASECATEPVGIILLGALWIIVGVSALGIYLKVADCWPCACCNKKQKALARQLQCESGRGQGIMALNPSTDPLVSHTQYAPVSELPLMRVEDEERRNLMPDNKDCLSSAEESDRMLEPDPRIVLRPMGCVEDA